MRNNASGRIASIGCARIAIVNGNRIGTDAGSRLTGVSPRTSITVITRRAVRLRRVRACAGRRIAGARVVTLIARCARHRITGTHSGLTAVARSASITVITSSAVSLRRVRTHAG